MAEKKTRFVIEKDIPAAEEYFTTIRKRDGRIASFDEIKIADAVFNAAQAVGGEDRFLAEELAKVVTIFLRKRFRQRIPGIEEIQDIVEKILIETGHARTAKAYILYREKRGQLRRKLRVRKPSRQQISSTDLALLVVPLAKDAVLPWDKEKIVLALQKEAGVAKDLALEIASAVEKRIFDSGVMQISTSLIRELVDNELFERGLDTKLKQQAVIGMPGYDLEQLVLSKSKENSNITANNPEAINLAIAENTLKQHALEKIFSPEVADAHLKGMIHVHDLGYPTRTYCSSHSLEYIKKYGLELGNLDTVSAPASHARTLTGHLNTFLASMQAYYAGALGVGYVNIFYAPYLVGMSYDEMKQEAQYMIFSGSQNAFSRGGQSLFIDFNVHTGIPDYLKKVPAIGPAGKYNGKTYGDYEDVAREFCRAMLHVWAEGDRDGHPFAFPKADLHVSQRTFEDPQEHELLKYACRVSSENGAPYFVFDRGDGAVLSQCCRLRQRVTDQHMIEHPESMRFCGFQNVTINLPQAAYRAGRGNLQGLYQEIYRAMDLAIQAHLQKMRFIARIMDEPGKPLWEVGKIAKDGRPYIDLNNATYIIGLVGLNECVQFLAGKELHEDDETFKLGLKIIAAMYLRAKEEEKKTGLRISLEESPAESATRRLAKVDLRRYPEAETVMKGDISRDEMYYTNSIHLRADAPVDLLTRIEKQAKFHSLIESGAIIHAFVGETKPSPESIYNLIKKTYYNTMAAQLVISPEFTICNECKKICGGLKDSCRACGSENVYGITRIVGYYSRVNNWNPSKTGELKDRQRGDYLVN